MNLDLLRDTDSLFFFRLVLEEISLNGGEPKGQRHSRPLSSRLFRARASARILSEHGAQIGVIAGLPQTSQTDLALSYFVPLIFAALRF
jgi:hypothetical protein